MLEDVGGGGDGEEEEEEEEGKAAVSWSELTRQVVVVEFAT